MSKEVMKIKFPGVFQKMMNQSMDVICAIDEAGNFGEVSTASKQFWGYDPEELRGMPLVDLIHKEYRSSTQEIFQEIRAGNEKGRFKNHLMRKDGGRMTVEWSLQWDEEDKLYYGVARDVGEKTVPKSSLEDSSEESYRYLFMDNPSPMVIWDFNTQKIIEGNTKALEMYGYSREEFLQLDIRDIRPEEDIPLIEAFAQSEEAYSKIQPIWRHKKKNGQLMYVHATSQLIDFRARRAALVHLNDVTESIKAEEGLQKANKIISDYRFSLDQSSIVAITDGEGTIIHANDIFCTLSKYSKEELIGQDHRIINSGYHDREFFRNMWSTIARGEVWRGEIRNQAKDGSLYWVDSTIVPFLDKNGIPYQYMSVRFEITAGKKFEEDILIKSKLLSAIAEVISTLFQYEDWEEALDKSFGIVGEAVSVDRVYYFENSFDPITGEGFASQRLEWTTTATSQIDNPELQNLPFELVADFIVPLRKRQAFKAIVSQMSETHTKEMLLAQDIQSILVLPICIQNHFYGFIGFDDCKKEREWREDEISFLQTLTSKLASAIEKRQGDFALKEAYAEKSIILESIGDAFFAVDKSWTVTYWNKKAETILGTNKEEIIGKNLWEVYNDVMDSPFYTQYSKALHKNETVHFEEFYPKLKIWVEVSVYPSPSGLSIYFKDVSERKNNEEKLKRINKELALSNSELEQFAFVASHDLQEPLRMITSFLAQLERKYKDLLDDKGKRYIHFASDGAKRMRLIILDLLEYSRVGRTEEDRQLINLEALLKEVVGLNRKIMQEKKAKVTWEEFPELYTFKSPLRLLFQNLISNALKYQYKEAVPVINISYEETITDWQFVVSDNGIGIDSEYFEKIFTIFQRLHNKDEYSGTGVGLAICKKLVENFGGEIWVESEEGKGSKFYFTLPK
ncbi:MAG: PAS domain S-box protein [Anditalea sp.]